MIDQVDYSLVYQELGLNPIWKEKLQTDNLKKEICFYQKFSLNSNTVFFIGLTDEKEIISKQKLFANISNYLCLINENTAEKYKKTSQECLISLEQKPDFILLLADNDYSLSDDLLNVYNSSKVIKSKTSMVDMIRDTKNKEILWQDIRLLINKIKIKST